MKGGPKWSLRSFLHRALQLVNTVVVEIKIQGRLFLTKFSPFGGSCFNCGPLLFFRFSLSLVLCRAFHFEKRDRRKEIKTR